MIPLRMAKNIEHVNLSNFLFLNSLNIGDCLAYIQYQMMATCAEETRIKIHKSCCRQF